MPKREKVVAPIDEPLVLGTDVKPQRDVGVDEERGYISAEVPKIDYSYSTCDTPLPPERRTGAKTADDGGDDKNSYRSLNPDDDEQRDATIEDIRKQARIFREMAMPYFRESREGRCLFGGMLVFCLLRSTLNVVFSFVLRDFWTALADKDADEFKQMLLYFTLAVAFAVPVNVMFTYQKDQLTLRWREWMTERTLKLYFRNRVYYGIDTLKKECRPCADEVTTTVSDEGGYADTGIDNPDQRMAEDVDSFTYTSLSLVVVIIRSSIDMVLFSVIICMIYPVLLIVLAVYATVGTLLTWIIGKKLVRLNFAMQKREADFRYSLVRFRENAESIAFYVGEAIEGREVRRRLSRVVSNKQDVIITQRTLSFFTVSYEYLIQVLPIVVVAPLYFADKVQFGVVSQSAGAFFHVLEDISLVITEFEALSSFSASIDRLGSFLTAVRNADPMRSEMCSLLGEDSPSGSESVTCGKKLNASHKISVRHPKGKGEKSTPILSVERLTIFTPDRKRTLISNLNFSLRKRDNLLIVGASGAGKSSLLRAVAGLWSTGSGSVDRPPDEKVFFLPQRPYCPQGSLRDQVLYPSVLSPGEDDVVINQRSGAYESIRNKYTDKEILGFLKSVGLKSLAFRVGGGDPYVGLNKTKDWGGTLSLGEQQRLAFARVLANMPFLVVLDESTSALDMEAEDMLYKLLQEISGKQKLSYMSVGHRPSLLKYHNKKLTLIRRGEWTYESINTVAPYPPMKNPPVKK
mmetsp:Transcript_39852/g.77846  ORF Transcript_39852/g.77846 Transcript_39852/m.77846 type:complete len:746 (+) Transcript_39852:188-2425(+)